MQGHLVDASSDMRKLGFDSQRMQLVCPKPRRLVTAPPEFLNPIRCKHTYSNTKPSSEILGMLSTCKSDEGSRELTSTGCSPSCYCGSPPSRSDNPLVHDVQFVHQIGLSSLPLSKLSSGLEGFSS